jgi:ribonuclease Z
MPTTLNLDGLRLDCASRAGDSTWLRVRPPGLAIDVGRGTPRLGGVGRVFLTHGHLDHSLGVPYLLSMRAGRRGEPLEVYCPKAIESPLRGFLEAASRLDERRFAYRLRGLEPGERVEVGADLRIEPFGTDHVVAGLGYHLIRRRHRLREALRELPGRRIAELRAAGETVDEDYEERWLSCTGDTTAAVFDAAPELFTSRVLVVECTFLARGHARRARRFKHVHLDDLVDVGERFSNTHLVLYHLSRRHRAEDLRRAVRERLRDIAPEVHVVG